MNEIFKRRLIGLAVLLVLAFTLSLLLPGTASRPGSGDVPTTTVALGVLPPPAEPARPPADSAPALQLAPALKPSETTSPGTKVPTLHGAPATQAPSASATTAAATAARSQTAAAREKPAPSSAPQPAAPKPHLLEAPTLSKPVAVAPSPSTAVTAKPAVATPPIAAESRPAAGTVWYVQIGSFAEAGNAQTTLSLLQNIGYRGESTRIASSAGKALFRVRLGPYPTEPVARQALDKVSRQGYPQARLAAEARP